MTQDQILELISSHKQGWEQEPTPSLFITHNPRTGNFAVRDWSGYLCKTNDPTVLLELVQMESLLKGAVRELVSGKSLIQISEDYQRKIAALSSKSSATSPSGLADLDFSDLTI